MSYAQQLIEQGRAQGEAKGREKAAPRVKRGAKPKGA